MSLKTYTGSCHCGKVRFEADIDLSAGSGKCNCSICSKLRAWGSTIKPDAFRLLAGESELTKYEFGSRSVQRRFCKHCGIHLFGTGHIAEIGGDFCSVNLACLDQLDPAELASIPVRYSDGLNNNWWSAPQETRYL